MLAFELLRSIKDRYAEKVEKVDKVESVLKDKLQRAYNTSRKLKVKVIASACRRHAVMTRARARTHTHTHTHIHTRTHTHTPATSQQVHSMRRNAWRV